MTAPSEWPHSAASSDPERVEERHRLVGHRLVEPARQDGHRIRRAVADAVGDDHAVARRERVRRGVERVRLVTPAAVQQERRRAVAALADVHAER
jgi:hypothetical protein